MHIYGLPQELWCPEDFASDHLVLKITIHGTIMNLVGLGSRYGGNIAMVCVTLYLMQLSLFGVNKKDVLWEENIIYHWAPLLWFTIFDHSASKKK